MGNKKKYISITVIVIGLVLALGYKYYASQGKTSPDTLQLAQIGMKLSANQVSFDSHLIGYDKKITGTLTQAIPGQVVQSQFSNNSLFCETKSGKETYINCYNPTTMKKIYSSQVTDPMLEDWFIHEGKVILHITGPHARYVQIDLDGDQSLYGSSSFKDEGYQITYGDNDTYRYGKKWTMKGLKETSLYAMNGLHIYGSIHKDNKTYVLVNGFSMNGKNYKLKNPCTHAQLVRISDAGKVEKIYSVNSQDAPVGHSLAYLDHHFIVAEDNHLMILDQDMHLVGTYTNGDLFDSIYVSGDCLYTATRKQNKAALYRIPLTYTTMTIGSQTKEIMSLIFPESGTLTGSSCVKHNQSALPYEKESYYSMLSKVLYDTCENYSTNENTTLERAYIQNDFNSSFRAYFFAEGSVIGTGHKIFNIPTTSSARTSQISDVWAGKSGKDLTTLCVPASYSQTFFGIKKAIKTTTVSCWEDPLEREPLVVDNIIYHKGLTKVTTHVDHTRMIYQIKGKPLAQTFQLEKIVIKDF